MTYDKIVLIDDVAKDITMKAGAIISGGFLVDWLSGTDCVGSDISTYASEDIVAGVCDSAANCVGIAMQTATSGALVKVAQQGTFVLPVGSGGVTGGTSVVASGYENMVETIATDASGTTTSIGRALTAGTALTGFAVIRLDV